MHIWLDGPLIAYQNAVKVDHRFNFGQLSIRNMELPSNGVVNAMGTRFRLVELREDSAIYALGEKLDPEYIPDTSERCEKAAQFRLKQLMRETRKLMAGFNSSQTSSWRKGASGNPSTSVALAAHMAGDRP